MTLCNFKKARIVITALFVLFVSMLNAQSVKLKNDKVIIDGKEVFKYKSEVNSGVESISIYDLNTNEELIFIKEDDGGTYGSRFRDDDFTIYRFLKENIKVEVSTYDLWKNDIKFLYKQGVFDLEGKLNLEKIKLFKEKFDENISERRKR